jgi:hypothetical protein
MKCRLFAALFAVPVALIAEPVRSQDIQLMAGVACRPATAADFQRLDFSNGSATNAFPAPGGPDQVANVVCALPPVAPRHALVRVTVAYFDPSARWARAQCAFHNLFPTEPPVFAPLTVLRSNPRLATVTLLVDPFTFVPHAVRCSVRPGQSLYAVETELEPLD